MNDPLQRAIDLATYYFRMTATHSGVDWTGDNDSEIREMVAYIVEAARTDLRPRFEAALERISALEAIQQEQTESVRGTAPGRKDATCARD